MLILTKNKAYSSFVAEGFTDPAGKRLLPSTNGAGKGGCSEDRLEATGYTASPRGLHLNREYSAPGYCTTRIGQRVNLVGSFVLG